MIIELIYYFEAALYGQKMVPGKGNPETTERNSEGDKPETTERNSEGGKGNPEVAERNLEGDNSHQ